MEERIFFASAAACPWMPPEDMGSNRTEAPTRITAAGAIRGGAFTAPEATVEDMIAFDLKFNGENGHPFGPQEGGRRGSCGPAPPP